MEAVQRSSHGRRVGSAQTCQRLRPLGTVAGHSYLDLPCRIQSCFGLWFCKLLLHGICSSFHHRSPNKLIRFWESQSERCELALSLSCSLCLSSPRIVNTLWCWLPKTWGRGAGIRGKRAPGAARLLLASASPLDPASAGLCPGRRAARPG